MSTIHRTLFVFICSFISPSVFPYMIENNLQTGTFYGQFCAACWHGVIPQGETRGCPGNTNGCKNTTWIYRHIGTIPAAESVNLTDTHCYVTGREPVTAHGKVVFNRDGMVVYGDDGRVLYQDEYIYYGDDGLFNSLVIMPQCKRFQRWLR